MSQAHAETQDRLTPELRTTARSQLLALQQASGVPLTQPETRRILDEAARTRGGFIHPFREQVIRQVTQSFCDVLRARGDERSVELADRIARIQQERSAATQPAGAT